MFVVVKISFFGVIYPGSSRKRDHLGAGMLTDQVTAPLSLPWKRMENEGSPSSTYLFVLSGVSPIFVQQGFAGPLNS